MRASSLATSKGIAAVGGLVESEALVLVRSSLRLYLDGCVRVFDPAVFERSRGTWASASLAAAARGDLCTVAFCLSPLSLCRVKFGGVLNEGGGRGGGTSGAVLALLRRYREGPLFRFAGRSGVCGNGGGSVGVSDGGFGSDATFARTDR
jgi:hypothetical protein